MVILRGRCNDGNVSEQRNRDFHVVRRIISNVPITGVWRRCTTVRDLSVSFVITFLLIRVRLYRNSKIKNVRKRFAPGQEEVKKAYSRLLTYTHGGEWISVQYICRYYVSRMLNDPRVFLIGTTFIDVHNNMRRTSDPITYRHNRPRYSHNSPK